MQVKGFKTASLLVYHLQALHSVRNIRPICDKTFFFATHRCLSDLTIGYYCVKPRLASVKYVINSGAVYKSEDLSLDRRTYSSDSSA